LAFITIFLWQLICLVVTGHRIIWLNFLPNRIKLQHASAVKLHSFLKLSKIIIAHKNSLNSPKTHFSYPPEDTSSRSRRAVTLNLQLIRKSYCETVFCIEKFRLLSRYLYVREWSKLFLYRSKWMTNMVIITCWL
jgi:hypothetical protein